MEAEPERRRRKEAAEAERRERRREAIHRLAEEGPRLLQEWNLREYMRLACVVFSFSKRGEQKNVIMENIIRPISRVLERQARVMQRRRDDFSLRNYG